MQLRPITEKRGAIELSIGTVVIVVIAMTMLILGIVLVRNIFGGATESVETLNEKVKAEITNIFAEEGSKIAIKLGSDKTAKIKQGTNGFGVGIGAKTNGGVPVFPAGGGAANLRYTLKLTNNDCPTFGSLNGPRILDHELTSGMTSPMNFEDSEGDRGFTRLVFNIPDAVGECNQRIQIQTLDSSNTPIASATFRVQIISGGIFS